MTSLSKKTEEKIRQRVAKETRSKGGHLVLKESGKSPKMTIDGKSRNLFALYHITTTGEIYDHLKIQYLKNCDVKDCISHYVPIQNELTSPLQMNHYDHTRYMEAFDKNSKVLEGSHKTNTINPSEPIGDCIVWKLRKNKKGYGQCSSHFGTQMAHVFSYMLWNLEEVPDGKIVRHKCIGRRDCVNPDHLELGTQKQNIADKKRDGTMPRGESHGSSKLTEEQVKSIREGGKRGESSTVRATKFNVTAAAISLIDNGKTWANLLTEEEKEEIKKNRKPRKRKLTFDEAEEIREKYAEGEVKRKELADDFGISPATVSSIIDGISYPQPKSEEEQAREYFRSTRERILSHIDKVTTEDDKKEHWLWNASTYSEEYGQSSWKHLIMPAHVVSYLAFNEILLEDMDWECIRHDCRHKKCVNPDHLTAGTHQENVRDKIRDGTMPRGESHPNSKISEEVVRKIKESRGEDTVEDRAARFGVSARTIAKIDSGQTWAWLSV